MISPYQMENIKKKFFQFDVNSKNMQEVTKERLDEIKDDINFFDEKIFPQKNFSDRTTKLERYYKCLAYILSRRDYTYDEKAVFVIMACDPNLILYKSYKSIDLIPNSVIEGTEDKKEQADLRMKNDIIKTEFSNYVRSVLGFYEPKLLKLEELYFKKFCKEFLPASGKDYGNQLFNVDYNFEEMTTTDYLMVKNAATKYMSEVENIEPKTVIYHSLFQNNILHLYTFEQRLLFFIFVVDPDLEYYQIYLEECMWDKIKERTMAEKGYFNENLFMVEKEYFRVFQPENVSKNLW